MLGASEAQCVAIDRANEMGLKVITVDNRPDNPGHLLAHQTFNMSTTDKDKIFKLAKQKRINAILSYASDAGILTASIVAERLGLPGDSTLAVSKAQDKLLLRGIQKNLGHPVPDFSDAADDKSLEELWRKNNSGLVIKPTDRYGSAGLYIFDTKPKWKELMMAVKVAQDISFSGRVIVEQRIQRDGMQFGGDYIFYKGSLLFSSYADQYQFRTFTTEAGIGNLVPSAHKLQILEESTRQVIELIRALGLQSGTYNTDMIVSGGEVFLLDFGARLGGNMLGEVHRYATGVDFTKAAIDLALGHKPDVTAYTSKTNAGHLVIHSDKTGLLKSINFSSELQKLILVNLKSKSVGGFVEPYRSTKDRIGILVIQSDDRDELINIYKNPIKHFGLKFV